MVSSSLTDLSTSSRRSTVAFGKILEEGRRWDSSQMKMEIIPLGVRNELMNLSEQIDLGR